MRVLIRLSLVICVVGVFGVWLTAAEQEAVEIDLLATPPGPDSADWLWVSEDPAVGIDKVWSTEDGVLSCKGKPRGYIHTAKDYKNFVLKLEWRWPVERKAANGGVLIRMTGKHKIWPRSLEAQLNIGQAGDFWGLGGFPLKGPADRMKEIDGGKLGKLTNLRKTRPAEKKLGEWNQYEIIAKGDTVTLKINGRVVNEATGCDVEAGKICLTAEGQPYQFRNVRLTVLED